MLLAIQIIMTVSVSLGVLMALGGLEIPDNLEDAEGAVIILAAGVIVLIWLAPYVAMITLFSLACIRKVVKLVTLIKEIN